MKRVKRLEAQNLLRDCLKAGRVIPGRHFRDELKNENVDLIDAWEVLRTGQIYNEPEFHTGMQEWNYRVEGHEIGGKWLAIVFSFKAIDTAFLITVFSVHAKNK